VAVRRILTVTLVGTLGTALLAGCSDEPEPPPEITFSTDGRTVTVRPFRYCDAEVTECREDRGAVAYLRVPAGLPVDVRVPEQVAGTPWSVTVGYVTAAGEQKDEMLGVFTKGENTFTARVPAPGGSIRTVEVKQAGGRLEDVDGQQQVVPRGVWSLQLQPA
jgi:hypothetical protein